MAGIYIHIPFCKQACTYCDFHFSTNIKNKTALVNAICKEIELTSSYLDEKVLNTIYFGGGTPSLLSPPEINSIFDTLTRFYSWDPKSEITLETNPDDITKENLLNWKKAGVNRLSIGLQSFDDEELRWMNRAHNSKESLNSVLLAQENGIENITIDLIYGSRFQTIDSWEKTLKTAISLNTRHISSYNLTIEEKTTLGLNHKKGREPAVNDDLSSHQFLMMKDILEAAGFIHYEISNFAKPGYLAQHNSNYWLQKPYLGLGPSAHSFNGQSRQWNVKSNANYISAIEQGRSFFEVEELSLHNSYNEYIMTRLRTIWGCDVKEMRQRFGEEMTDRFLKLVSENKNLFIEKAGVFTLNKTGLLQADGIASDFFIV